MKRIVAKFGGSSVKDCRAMIRSASVVANFSGIKVIVVSAIYDTTNQLEEIQNSAKKSKDEAVSLLKKIIARHLHIADELAGDSKLRESIQLLEKEGENLIGQIFLGKDEYADQIYSLGERLSSLLFCEALKIVLPKYKVLNFDVRNVLKTNGEHGQALPLLDKIAEHIDLLEQLLKDETIIVTQGFIGMSEEERTTTLGREGSDYTATLLGEAIGADLVQIWTDVPGIFTKDPKVFSDAELISKLSYEKAREMACNGAKVLFYKTLEPAKRARIPVFVGSSFSFDEGGTTIFEID